MVPGEGLGPCPMGVLEGPLMPPPSLLLKANKPPITEPISRFWVQKLIMTSVDIHSVPGHQAPGLPGTNSFSRA